MDTLQPPPVPGFHVFKDLLLILDGLDTSMAAATLAVSMGRDYGSKVTAVYVVDTPTMDFLVQQHVLHLDERAEIERDMETSAAHYLAYVAETAKRSGVETACLVRKGRLSQIALQQVRERDVSALVIGGFRTSSRHDLAVTERNLLLVECTCPVILVYK